MAEPQEVLDERRAALERDVPGRELAEEPDSIRIQEGQLGEVQGHLRGALQRFTDDSPELRYERGGQPAFELEAFSPVVAFGVDSKHDGNVCECHARKSPRPK